MTRGTGKGKPQTQGGLVSPGRSADVTVVYAIKDTYNFFTICDDYPSLRFGNAPLT